MRWIGVLLVVVAGVATATVLPVASSGAGIDTRPPDFVSAETGLGYHHGYAFLSIPKYPYGATHFDYVNPDAPKGGIYHTREMGTWDNFNPVALRGRTVMGVHYFVKEWRFLWDSLLRDALDEPASYYGLIAKGLSIAPDGSWIAFMLREEARFHDGAPITVEDVLFTFEVSKTVANPEIMQELAAFTRAEAIGTHEVKFHIDENFWGNPILPTRIGNMPIFPKHYWAGRDITKTTVEPPLGSGPYKVGRFSVGRWVEWDRVQDYWAKDLLVMKGHWNFDRLRFDYFRDDQVGTEALKGNVIDVHIESVPRTWAVAYDIPAYRAGVLKKMRHPMSRPAGMWWTLFFNLDQKRFQDVRVREALWLLGDYDWGAARSYHFFGRATSLFTGSELASSGLPSELELKFLEPLRGQIPERVFTEPFKPPPEQGGGYNRGNVLKAAQLLREAGWVVRDGLLTHEQTGEHFDVRMLAVSAALGRSFISYIKRLERLGITASIHAPEISNWLYRMRAGDFDIGSIWFLPEMPPTNLLERQFLSAGADQEYSYNWLNLRDPAVDALIGNIQDAATYDEFVAACRAFDRVMLWNFYFVPSTSRVDQHYVYWDKFDGPPWTQPLSRHHVQMTWWWNPEKAARVAAFLGEEEG